MSVAGGVLQGIGSLINGWAAKSAGKAQATQLLRGAEQTRREGAIAGGLVMEDGRRAEADMLVNAAANGGGTGGSALNVLKDLQRRISFQATNTIISAENRARNLVYEARVAKRQGALGEINGYLNAGASFLNAAGQAGGGADASAGGA